MLMHRHPSAKAPPRVVILGAHGFVASHLAAALAHETMMYRAVGSAEVDLTAPGSVIQLRTILRSDDALVITSALTPEHGRGRATFLKNVTMLDNLCACLAQSPCAHIVYLSSDSVYDCRSTPISEETCCESGDLYALSHIVREKLIAGACQRRDIPLTIVRPCAIYGAGDTHNSYGPNRFLRTAGREGKITLFGQGEEERDHVYIDDVTWIIRKLLLYGSTGVINAVSGISLSFKAVAAQVVEAIGTPVEMEHAPRRIPIVHKRFDPAALVQAFPDFLATPLDTGIRRTLSELKDSHPEFASGGSAQ